MRISSSKSSYNFYESFSDLLFCTLVLFIVLILTLALNVNKKVELMENTCLTPETAKKLREENAAQAQNISLIMQQKTDADENLTKIITENQTLRSQLEMEKRKCRIAQMELEKTNKSLQNNTTAVAESRKQLKDLKARNDRLMLLVSNKMVDDDEAEHFLANQFNGQTAAPFINVAYADPEADGYNVCCYPIPGDIMRGYSTPILGESEEKSMKRRQRFAKELLDTYRDIDPLNPQQYSALMRSFSICGQITSAEDQEKGLGILLDKTGAISSVLPESPAAFAGIQCGDKLVSFDGRKLDHLGSAKIKEILSGVLNSGAHNRNPLPEHTLIIKRLGNNIAFNVKCFPYRTHAVSQMSHVILSLVVSRMLTPEMGYLTTKDKINKFITMNNSGLFPQRLIEQGTYTANFSANVSFGRSELPFSINCNGMVDIGGVEFSRKQFMVILRSIEGAVSIKFVPNTVYSTIPADFVREVMLPSGFINRTPYYRMNAESIGLNQHKILTENPQQDGEVSIAIVYLNSGKKDKITKGLKLANELLELKPPLSATDITKLKEGINQAEENEYLSEIASSFNSGNTDKLRVLVHNPVGKKGKNQAIRYSHLMTILKNGTESENDGKYLDAYRAYMKFLHDSEAQKSKYAQRISAFMDKFPREKMGKMLVDKGDENLAQKKYSDALASYIEAQSMSVCADDQIDKMKRIGMQLFQDGINYFNDGMRQHAICNLENALACFEPNSPERENIVRWVIAKGLDKPSE